jgi:hypothetical protein
MFVANQSKALKILCNFAEGRTVHRQEHRENIVTDMNVVLMDPIVRVQQPPGTSLLNGVDGIACRKLNGRRSCRLGVPTHQVVQGTMFRQSVAKILTAQLFGGRIGVREENECLPGREGFIGKGGLDTDHAFIADRGDFHHHPAGERRKQRTDAAIREVDVPYWLAIPVKPLLRTKRNSLEKRLEPRELVVRQRSKQPVRRVATDAL